MRGPSRPGRRLALAILACGVCCGSSPSPAEEASAGHRPWRRVYIEDPPTAYALRDALGGAARRLETPRCHAVFSSPDFRDRAGRPLDAKQASLAADGPSYLDVLLFYDGSKEKVCRSGAALAFTEPGSRVVFVCGRRFWQAWKNNSGYAEAAVIHEALHTLGLGENPPTSVAITKAVLSYCG